MRPQGKELFHKEAPTGFDAEIPLQSKSIKIFQIFIQTLLCVR
jgi:hypothetical protein